MRLAQLAALAKLGAYRQATGGHWEAIGSVTFELGAAIGTGSGGHGRPREAMGGHGFGNFRAGSYHWDRLGRPREAVGGHRLGNFRAGNYHRDSLGTPREAMGSVTFGLGITIGTGSGGHGRPWEAMITGGHGRPWVR